VSQNPGSESLGERVLVARTHEANIRDGNAMRPRSGPLSRDPPVVDLDDDPHVAPDDELIEHGRSEVLDLVARARCGGHT